MSAASIEQNQHVPFAPGSPELEAVLRHGVLLRFRRRQKLALSAEDGAMLYLVVKGALLLDLIIEESRRQVLMVLLPGDAYPARLLAHCPGCRLVATGPTEVVRLREEGVTAIGAELPRAAQALTSRIADLLKGALLHEATIGRLGGEERLASYLLEIGARSGAIAAGVSTIDMPLTRTDIADYLALNADTLSRIMSRLRVKGAIGRASRGKLIVRSWSALRSMSPIADVVAPG